MYRYHPRRVGEVYLPPCILIRETSGLVPVYMPSSLVFCLELTRSISGTVGFLWFCWLLRLGVGYE